jgi:hypothetical protein
MIRLHSPIPVLAALGVSWLYALGTIDAFAAEAWVDSREIGPFVCQASFPLAEYAPLLADLPELQRELARTLGIRPTRQFVDIYLFGDAAEHRAYIEQHFPHVPYRRALFVKEGDNAGVYAYRHAELDVDLRHECTHALLHSSLPVVPLWLDEGLAEYFEVPASRRAFDHPHYEALRWNMRLGMVRSIEALELRGDLAEMGAYDYRYSWAWVHFMLHGPEPAHRTLVTYLANLQAGLPQGTSRYGVQQVSYAVAPQPALAGPLSAMLAEAVPNPTEKMIQHFKHWRE